MKVCILTEGGKNIGLGHITRCVSICQAFEEVGIQSQLIVNGDEAAQGLLKDKNRKAFDWVDDQEALFDTVGNADIVFIDSYLAEYDVYKKISETVETAVYFDDNMRIEYPRGFVINGAIFAERMPYPKKRNVAYLLGIRYAPLRKEFWDIPAKPIRDNIEIMMITFGGADMHNLTPKVLKLLIDAYPELLKKVIIAENFQNITEVEEFRDNNTELIYFPNATEMKEIMLGSDIAITASGQTLYELARIGVPTIGICVAQNQSQNIQGWEKSGFLEYIGWYNDENLLDNLREAVNKLVPHEERFRRNKIGKKYIDGNGSKRIIGKLINKSEVRSKVEE